MEEFKKNVSNLNDSLKKFLEGREHVLFSFWIALLLILLSKTAFAQQTAKAGTSENEAPAVYYEDFDLFHFEGIGPPLQGPTHYPCIKVIHTPDSVFVTAFFLVEGKKRAKHHRFGKHEGYYTEKIQQKAPDFWSIDQYFFTKDHILQFNLIRLFGASKDELYDVIQYTPTGSVTLTFGDGFWIDPGPWVDLDSYSTKDHYSKISRTYQPRGQYLDTAVEVTSIRGGDEDRSIVKETHKLMMLPHQQNAFSFFWNIYLGHMTSM